MKKNIVIILKKKLKKEILSQRNFYHFGIEQGFFKESLVCDLNDKNMNLSKEDILKTLQKNTVSCKDVNFRILGFSLATLNTITSLILTSITIKLYQNYEKNKQN